MTDTNNLDVVKTELTQLDILCEQFEYTHNLYLEELDSPEDKETASCHYADKENDIFEYRKQVANWITSCEEQISNHLDGLSDTSKRSRRSRSSRTSRASSSFQSARLKEKAKVAELMAERSLLQEKIKLQVAEEQLQLDLQIARAQAREKVFAEMEEEQKVKLPEQDKSLDSFIALPTPSFDGEPLPPVNTPRGPTGIKSERGEIERESRRRPLNPEASEFYYRAFPVEVKKEDVAHSTNREDEILKEIFRVQQEQIQGMFASQNQIATAITLPQPEVPKFKGDPMDFKTFLMAFDTRIQSKVISSTDRLYFLDQHLVGEAKELISGCLHMEPDEGYLEARRLLEKEYGDPYKVSSAYMRKLTSWPTLKYDDGPALKSLSIFLRKCNSAMKTISHLAVLNHPPNMQSVVQKLPFSLQGKWRENVVKTRRKDGKVAGFRQLVEFVEYAAETANDPVYGKEALSKAKHRTNGPTEENKKFPPSKSKVESFATNLDTVFKSPTSNGTGSSSRNISTRKCPLCTKSHDLDDCNDYKRKSVEERRSFLAEKALCFACYGENHQSKRCTKKRTCKKCKKPHPTLLHIDGFSLPKENSTAGQETTDNDKPLKVNNARVDIPQDSNSESNILLQTILPVTVTQKGIDKPVKTYAFYDNGSAGCFITEQLKIRLKAASTETKLQLGTMHGRTLVDSAIVKDLIVTDVNGQNPVELPRAYTRQEIPAEVEQIPTPEIVGRIEHLKEIASEIPAYDPELEIGLLIGSNCPSALVPLSVVPNQGDGPFAIRLKHGWTVSGPLHLTTEPHTNKVTANRITVRELESCKEVITPKSLLNLFELDFNEKASCNLPEDLGYSQEDRKFMALVSDGIRYTGGHYEIPLPFRHQNVNLPNNREQAFKRLLWQEKKMMQNEKYRNDYVAFINDMIEKGYAEKVPEESLRTDANNAWYIPHHGVYHPKKPEKIRVVFDCSAKFCGTSLNDQLLQGPDLTNSLVGVLTRFRQEPVAFMADIEAMFYQVRVPVTQRNFLRFLWWSEGDLNAELVEYRMVVHPFGAVSSPSCSNFALRHTAKENEDEIGYAVANTMRRNFYVDDCLRSVKTEVDGKNQITCLRQACAKGGFRLTKFISNHRSVLESIPEEERSKEVKLLDLNYDDLPIERALGVQWCVESDTFGFRIIVKDKPLTRRGILSSVSSIYDPLGFAAPFTLTAKKLLQDLCREEKLEWDDELPELYRNRWEKWRNELPLLERLNVDRCFKPSDFGEAKSREIHIFSDASATGYGSAAYLRLCNSESRIHCSFLMGKARLAPIKVMTIPRLELTAATISIRLGEVLKKELDDPPDVVKYHTDSTTVLRYIMNDQKRFQVFVANRVQTIRSLSHPSRWMYVETKSNPADDASRGINAQALLEHSRWIKGPEFLWQPEEDWR